MAGIIRQLRPSLRRIAQVKSTVPTRSYVDHSPKITVKDLALTLVAANKVFFDETDVKQIDIPTFNGVFGILPKHVPILAIINPGVVTVFEKDGNSKHIFVSSGTVCVNEDSTVQVLAEEAHYVEDLDLSAAKDSLAKAQEEFNSAPADQKEKAAIAVEIADTIVKILN